MPIRSSDEANEIREWLKRHSFRRTKIFSNKPGEVSWVKDRCQVQVRRDEADSYSLAIRADANSEWQNLDHVLSQLTEDAHRLVRAPIEIVVDHFLDTKVPESPSPGARLYAACRPWAYFVKVILQMLIGIGAIVGLCLVLAQAMDNYHGMDTWKSATELSINVITASLAAAGAVELAYTLYTPGPDEALDPLMLGLSAGILLVITRSDIAVGWQFFGIILGVISLWALFLIRRHFIDSDEL